jgi:hypothetical protein
MIGHRRWARRVALLAADALPPAERGGAAAHVQRCARCAEALAGLRRLDAILAEDPALEAAVPIPLEALATRVRARLEESVPQAPARAAPRLLAAAAAAAAVAALAGILVQRGPVAPPPAAPGGGDASAAVGPAAEELLRRMERSLAREQAARYLTDAQDVLVTVAAGPPPCPETRQTIEVEDEARRSRQLLARRALLVDLGRDDVASAHPVLAEVEEVLREVAALPSCIRPGRLRALERDIERRRLLMKIDLMTRELTG